MLFTNLCPEHEPHAEVVEGLQLGQTKEGVPRDRYIGRKIDQLEKRQNSFFGRVCKKHGKIEGELL